MSVKAGFLKIILVQVEAGLMIISKCK